MEMEMRAAEDIAMAEDLTPPLPPLSFSLHDTFLSSHCSSCSVPLPTPPFPPIFPPEYSHLPTTPALLYCSPLCSSRDSPLHLSSAEHHLLQSFSPSTSHPDSACLRLSLRLLYLLPLLQNENVVSFERISGLVTNYRKVIQAQGDDELLGLVKDGARDMILARTMMLDESDSITLMAEAVISLVMMNAVEVQDKNGRAIGIAVYDTSFSWINHSCSPNSCYRFSIGRSETGGQLRFLISPATAGDSCGAESLNNTLKPQKSKFLDEGIGPRIIVRSINRIKKAEEITIAYTDLLQPKATRQSELWLKYRFNCCCKRCIAIPATYVDYVLQEPSVQNDEAIEKLMDSFDNTIAEYISFSNPESCCEKLENLLTHGRNVNKPPELKDQETPLNLLHHLYLNTYTTLASVYKVLACDLLALDPQNSKKLQVAGFNKIKASAAYSLLLAVLTNHLFQSEHSLIAFAANCWGSAGESILSVAKSSVWESCFGLGPPVVSENSSFLNHNLFSAQLPILEFEDSSKQFQNSIGDGITKTWSFLTHEGSSFLKQLNDLDISFFLTMAASSDSEAIPTIRNQERERNVSGSEFECSNQLRGNFFQLGSHCLVYGAFLAYICYGKHSELVTNALNLNSERKFSDRCGEPSTSSVTVGAPVIYLPLAGAHTATTQLTHKRLPCFSSIFSSFTSFVIDTLIDFFFFCLFYCSHLLGTVFFSCVDVEGKGILKNCCKRRVRRGCGAVSKMQASGLDSDGREFNNSEEMWREEVGDQSKRSEWYLKGVNYWQGVEASVDGVLGGYGHVNDADIKESEAFLNSLLAERFPDAGRGQNLVALDCGSGIGRVTKNLLIRYFHEVDLLEPVPHFLDAARVSFSPENLIVSDTHKAANFYCVPLQDFTPEAERYNCIWIQWCIGHLADDDLVAFLKRAKAGLKSGGFFVLKENIARTGFVLDKEDKSVTRSDSYFKELFKQAGLHIYKMKNQKDFPQELFAVKLYALTTGLPRRVGTRTTRSTNRPGIIK